MLHPGALSQKKAKKNFFLFFFKFLGWHKKISFHATDEQEKKFIRDQFGKQVDVTIAGNFPNLLQVVSSPAKNKDELILGTIALISPMKNHLAVLESLRTCKQRIKWLIYGPVKDANYWQQCKTLMDQMPDHISVIYQGELPPTKLDHAMHSFQVFIMPSKSENFGHAIMEALSAGKPVITTNTTPFRGLQEKQAGYTIDYSRLMDQLPEAIHYFASMNQETFDTYADNAATHARSLVDINELTKQYCQLFHTA
jgi:glycosyltransferase involved in cell wall biosynthesis